MCNLFPQSYHCFSHYYAFGCFTRVCYLTMCLCLYHLSVQLNICLFFQLWRVGFSQNSRIKLTHLVTNTYHKQHAHWSHSSVGSLIWIWSLLFTPSSSQVIPWDSNSETLVSSADSLIESWSKSDKVIKLWAILAKVLLFFDQNLIKNESVKKYEH